MNESQPRLPKIIGSDTEFGNVVIGDAVRESLSGARAAHALLSAVDGIHSYRNTLGWRLGTTASAYAPRPGGSYAGPAAYDNPQDVGRKFLPSNGGCCYIDLDHFEICTPETTSAQDFVAAWHAMLRISQQALASANAGMPHGERIVATVNNSDGHGSSWGSHLSFLVHRQLFDKLCVKPERMPFYYLMSFLASSIVYCGAGKVGAENSHAYVPFQISQRADFFSTLYGPQTTFSRPLINTRDEALCGSGSGLQRAMSRLHVIFFDATLAPVATYLKSGVMQIVLAMLEDGCGSAERHLVDPLGAVGAWSHDPDLETRAMLDNGQSVTAVEHQLRVLEDLDAFVASGRAESYVPDAANIVELLADTLQKLAQRDWSGLTGRLDWVARRLLIEGALERNGLGWGSAEAKHLDLLFADLDPQHGLYWALARDGLIEQLATEAEIAYFVDNPPEDTRAWTRAMLLRRAGANAIDRVDWDRIRLRLPGDSSWSGRYTVSLGDPLGHGRGAAEATFLANRDLAELVEALGGHHAIWDAPADHQPVVPAGSSGWQAPG